MIEATTTENLLGAYNDMVNSYKHYQTAYLSYAQTFLDFIEREKVPNSLELSAFKVGLSRLENETMVKLGYLSEEDFESESKAVKDRFSKIRKFVQYHTANYDWIPNTHFITIEELKNHCTNILNKYNNL